MVQHNRFPNFFFSMHVVLATHTIFIQMRAAIQADDGEKMKNRDERRQQSEMYQKQKMFLSKTFRL